MKKKMALILLLIGVLTSYGAFELFTETHIPRSPASMPEHYESLTACEKQDVLWEKIISSRHQELPQYSKFGIIQLFKMSRQAIAEKGSLHSDFAPPGWKKYLHRRGVVAKVKLVPVNNLYSGVFKGGECSLLRLSLTYRPNGSKPVAPGLAFKVLRSGAPSANVSALVSLDGQDKDFNFFKHPMSNIVPVVDKLGQNLVHRIFRKVSGYPEELDVSDMASIDAQGKKTEDVKSPRQLFFVPAGPTFSSDEHDVREDLLTIAEGTTVYHLYALKDNYRNFNYADYKQEDVEKFVKDSIHVADIVTTSEFVASEFGDEGIFFRHQLRP
ncbi:MAG: hypothetical protein ACLGHN_08870 [Bacteriovoracia bacterium]